MSAMATRTVADPTNQLDTAIKVLSSAGREFQLTRFERGAHRALMLSVDVAVWSFVAFNVGLILFVIMAARGLPWDDLTPVQQAFLVGPLILSMVALAFAVIVGIVSLTLNIPLVRKLYLERARL